MGYVLLWMLHGHLKEHFWRNNNIGNNIKSTEEKQGRKSYMIPNMKKKTHIHDALKKRLEGTYPNLNCDYLFGGIRNFHLLF